MTEEAVRLRGADDRAGAGEALDRLEGEPGKGAKVVREGRSEGGLRRVVEPVSQS